MVEKSSILRLVMYVTIEYVEIECEDTYLFEACTVGDCAKCPTNKNVCTECSDGKGGDSSGATCTGKFIVLLKLDLFAPNNENYHYCYYYFCYYCCYYYYQ